MHISIPPDVWTGILGTVSALVGAGIGWAASLRVYKSQLNDQMLTSAYSLLTYLQVSYATLLAVKKHIDEGIADAAKNGLPIKPEPDTWWTRVKPMVGGIHVQQLNSSDLVFLARSKEFKLINDIITLSMRLPALIEAIELYSTLQPALMRELSNESTQGNVLRTVLTEEQNKRLYPRRLELHTLMESLVMSLNEDILLAREVLNRIAPAAQSYFGKTNFPRLEVIA